MQILIFFVILMLAAFFSMRIEKAVGISNKAFTNGLFYLCLGIISLIAYLFLHRDLQLLASTLVIVGFALSVFYFFKGIRIIHQKNKY